MSQQGLMIMNSPGHPEDDFIFQDANKTPNLNKQVPATTPITQLQKEILQDQSPASIDSMGFSKIQPLSVPIQDTSPLKLKKTQSIIPSQSLQTLNTFYSAQSLNSSLSETSHEFQSTLNIPSLPEDTTQDSETLLQDINTPVIQQSQDWDPLNEQSNKILVFTDKVNTRITSSSFYGDYNDGYLNEDNDATPLVKQKSQFDDSTPLVGQNEFNSTPPTSTSTTSPLENTVLAALITPINQANTQPSSNTLTPIQVEPVLKKTNSAKFLSKFKLKRKSSKRLSDLGKKKETQLDLTSMDNDLIHEESYTAYAATVSPPPPPPALSNDFNFVSPSNTVPIDTANDIEDVSEARIENFQTLVNARSELRLSPVRKPIKSPNELNKDIFENFKPSIMSLTSSYYPDSRSTYQFSVPESLASPTESTFSSTNDKRHTQVKLLNRSTTNLRHYNIVEEEEAIEKPVDTNDRKFEDIDQELANHEDDNYARLFLTLTHPLDATTLSQDEQARCLSFHKDDIAFIHDISETSGWAEVTLLSYKIETGWVPLNYFKPTIDDEDKQSLLLLFKSAGNFLSNRQSRPIYSSRSGQLKGYSFPYTTVDKITIGIKYFLKEIGCLSSKNENVYLSKTIREVRKKLLQDWHILRQKSREYIGTINNSKIELLELLVYQVLVKSILFLNIWKSENVFKPRQNLDRFKFENKPIPYLQYTPTLRERVKEDLTIFYSYFSMIIGRMDLIENNITGIKLLEIIRDHIKQLFQDFQFVYSEIIKITSSDYNILLTSFLKLITQFDNESMELINSNRKPQTNDVEYSYTPLGLKLIRTCSYLIIELNKLIKIELKIPRDKLRLKIDYNYLDFTKIKIDSKDFIKEASIGLLESKQFQEQLHKSIRTPNTRTLKRFSMFRSGNGLTVEGVDLLSEMLIKDEMTLHPVFKRGELNELKTDINLKENPYYIKNVSNEIVKDNNGVLIGSSFRGLVYFLTNELDEPSQLYISTFFLCFRIFSTSNDLLDGLITRFESNSKEIQTTSEIRIKNRRKLVLKMINIWVSSYWDHEDNFPLLPKLINFLNESASDSLPLESLQLLKLIATLMTTTSSEQLVPRVLLPNDERNDSRFSTMTIEDDENYELTLIQSNESLNSLASVSSSSISSNQLQEIDNIVQNYRKTMGPKWGSHTTLNELLVNWYLVKNTRFRFPEFPLQILSYHSLDLGKQLTLIENELFNNININELLNENFTEKKLHLNLSPNVQKSIMFTNLLSGYVLETILQPDINLRQRVLILNKWLKIALSCFNLRNFNSLLSIMTLLQSFLISRCHKIWSMLSLNYQKLFEKLIKIIQPDKNYMIYRKKLTNYLKNDDSIIVPYLNLFLQDLTFIVEGNSNHRNAETFLNQKLINIDKYFKITKILGDLQKLQKNYTITQMSSLMKSSSSNSLRKTISSSSVLKKSLSRLSISSLIDLNELDYLPLQELILIELLRVNQLNVADDDRSWKLSCLIQPREN